MLEKNEGYVLKECIRQSQDFFLKDKRKELYKHILGLVEKPLIELVLEKTFGNQKKCAKILGINRNTLHAKIKKLGIEIEKFKKEH